jgi:hypothetical protein
MNKPFSPIMTEVMARLVFQKGPGRILDGFKVSTEPVTEIEGADGLPSVRPFIPEASEVWRPKRPTLAELKVNLMVSTETKNGMPALLEALEKVLDAIETRPQDGKKDLRLNGLLRYPFSYSTQGQIGGVGSALQITLLMKPKAYPIRGNRRQSATAQES